MAAAMPDQGRTGSEFQDRLIEVALRKGYLDADKVQAALRMIQQEAQKGQARRLEQALLQKNFLSREQLVDIRRTMAQEGLHPRLDDFDILSRIGRGAMGTVYRARQRSLDRVVAIKLLASHLASNEQFVRRFVREARLAARVNHPSIVQVFDVGQWRGRHYIVMEYVQGRGLDRIIPSGGPLSEKRAASIAIQIAGALQQAEARGIVHRDIKPGNIVVTADGVAKLADLGLALARGEDSEENVGTPYYMSPEQARNDPDLDVRADIYSLGCTLFHAVTGRPPFEGATALETARMHAESPAPDARTYRADLSPAFSALLRRMMAKRPDDRFRDARELLAVLEKLEPDAGGAGRPKRGSLPCGGWALAFAIALLVLLLLLIAIAVPA